MKAKGDKETDNLGFQLIAVFFMMVGIIYLILNVTVA